MDPSVLVSPKASMRCEPDAALEGVVHPTRAVETPGAVCGPMVTTLHWRRFRETHARAPAPVLVWTLPTTARSDPSTHTPLA